MICLSPMKKHLFKNSRKTFQVQGSRNRNWENMETKNNNCPNGHLCSRACQEGDWKLHQHGPRNHRNSRASEDCPPWDCSHTQKITIHRVIHETYDCPKFMNWTLLHQRKEHDSYENKTLWERTFGRRCIRRTWGFFVSGTCECRNVVNF